MNRRRPYRRPRRLPTLTGRLRGSLIPSVAILMVAYFCYHAVQGNYGLLALKDIEKRHTRLSEQADALAAERAALEAKVALMRPDSLDLDMLDEQARAGLGFVAEDELIIILPHDDTAERP